MADVPNWLAPLISGLTVLVVTFFLNGAREKDKARDAKIDSIASRQQALELQISKDLATKDDLERFSDRLEALSKTMTEIRDMVIRLDERGKPHDKE